MLLSAMAGNRDKSSVDASVRIPGLTRIPRRNFGVSRISRAGAVMTGTAHIGRVGTLAVALGIGLAIAGPVGLAWADPEASDSGRTETATQSADSDDGETPSRPVQGIPVPGPPNRLGAEPVDSDNDVSRPTDTDEAAAQSADDGPDGSRPRASKTRSWPRARLSSTVPTRRLRQVTEESAEPSAPLKRNRRCLRPRQYPGPRWMPYPSLR